jgi:hypothetical protein
VTESTTLASRIGAGEGQKNMGMRWKRERDPVEGALREARPAASDELVGELSDRVLASAVRRSGRGSRLAFGTAVTVFTLGTFASVGGLSYAASSAQTSATTVKRMVAPATPKAHRSSAGTQYGEQSVLTPPVAKPKDPTARVAAATAASPPKSGTLPFTGLGLGATALLGSLLLTLGVVLRRREKRE